MKDCILCQAMIPFYGPDICKICQERINERERIIRLGIEFAQFIEKCEKREN